MHQSAACLLSDLLLDGVRLAIVCNVLNSLALEQWVELIAELFNVLLELTLSTKGVSTGLN